MAAYTQIGYSVADIAALKAIPPADRPAFAGALVSVVSTNQWFEFDPAGATGGVAPDSGSGRWYPMSREVLNANRTYFVRTDGNDNNTGLANTSGGAFLTIQKAIDVVASLDANGFDVTIQIADGTYTITQKITIKDPIGVNSFTILGNSATPANVVISSSSNIIYFDKRTPTNITLDGLSFVNTGSNNGVVFLNLLAGITFFRNLNFGATTTGSLSSQSHITVAGGATCIPIGSYTISGRANIHILVSNLSLYRDDFILAPPGTSFTVTLTGTPAFGVFVYCFGGTYAVSSGRQTFSGAATGTRYIVELSGVISTGGGANYFPGNVAGTTATQGQYT